MDERTLILKVSCPDAVGLLSRVTGFVAGMGGNLLEAHQFTDSLSGWFFARLAFEDDSQPDGVASYRSGFEPLAREIQADWTIRRAFTPVRTVVMVSREDHALAEILWRASSGELNVEIPLVISNHADLGPMVEDSGLSFLHVPMKAATKDQAFREIHAACQAVDAGLIVLARFMQVLPAWFCETYAARIINIHHSFLPAFAGADPYRRAYERGVKLIGATCHYATDKLDAGPIIEQEVVRVEHFHDITDLKRHGRDCERLALARGLRFHVEDRVLIHGPRAIVFRD
jgi:formyltetrahydrofolate deformylase